MGDDSPPRSQSSLPENCFCDMRGFACPRHRGEQRVREGDGCGAEAGGRERRREGRLGERRLLWPHPRVRLPLAGREKWRQNHDYKIHVEHNVDSAASDAALGDSHAGSLSLSPSPSPSLSLSYAQG